MNKSLVRKVKEVKSLHKKHQNEKLTAKAFLGGSAVERTSDLKKLFQMHFILVQEIIKTKLKMTQFTTSSRAKTSKK